MPVNLVEGVFLSFAEGIDVLHKLYHVKNLSPFRDEYTGHKIAKYFNEVMTGESFSMHYVSSNYTFIIGHVIGGIDCQIFDTNAKTLRYPENTKRYSNEQLGLLFEELEMDIPPVSLILYSF